MVRRGARVAGWSVALARVLAPALVLASAHALSPPALSAQAPETPEASPARGGAQGAEAAAPVRQELRPIAAPQIGRRIEETFRELQALAPHLRRQREVLAIRHRLPGFIREVERQRAVRALELLDGLSPRRLLDLEQDWARIAGRLELWQSTLESRGSELAEAQSDVRRSRRRWVLTREVERDEPLPTSQQRRIGVLLGRIDSVAQRLDARLTEVLDLQGELSDQGIRVSAITARISSARQKAREERLRRDHEPLWTGGEALDDARPEPSPGPILAEHWVSLRTFGKRELTGILFHGLLFLGLAIFFGLAQRGRAPADPRSYATPLRALRARWPESAALLALVCTPFVYPYVPSVVRGATLLALIPIVIRLAPYLISTPRRSVLELVTLGALSVVVALGYAPAPVRRLALLGLALGGAALCVRLHLEVRRSKLAGRPADRLHELLPLAAAPLLGAAWFDVVGNVERAAVWVDGAYTVIEMVVVIQGAVSLAGGLLTHVARHRYTRALRIFRMRRREATRTLLLAIRGTGIVALGYATLVGFDVLDPLEASTRAALRESYQFGSIDMSLGDVLSFGTVIAGTFVVVRLVHFLLSYELLPRLQLGTGTEAAISLTVSYLLVALGVILAFGLAGVDPEQLALLGGALGVGIGFGLQNVVSNFVSGLILVAERPIKVGDVIEVGGDLVGQVQRIGIRSSTVRSLGGAEVIVPNAELISGQLVNWTLTDARRRVDLEVGTGYRHDPSEVKKILEGVLFTQPGILSEPPAEVLCRGFGDSSIDFILRFWTGEYGEAIRLQSKLSQRVYKALAESGIEIPFPQRDVHIKGPPPESPP